MLLEWIAARSFMSWYVVATPEAFSDAFGITAAESRHGEPVEEWLEKVMDLAVMKVAHKPARPCPIMLPSIPSKGSHHQTMGSNTCCAVGLIKRTAQ